jgi:excisionase family DNA binding protein
MAMDSLTEWYRYIDQVSRPARRLADDDEEPEQWRPWKPNDEAPPVEAAIPAGAIPDLSAALGLSGPAEARHPGTVEYVDPTVHDQLAPIPTFSAPSLSAPAFEILIPRLGERAALVQPVETAPLPIEPETPQLVAEQVAELVEAASEVEPEAFEDRLARVFAETATPQAPAVTGEVDDAEDADEKGQGFRHWDLLSQIRSHDVAQNSYKSTFRETREELVQRLLDPPLTLEEAARLLGVCPTTVRRYTNKGQLRHFRTTGNQRRFRLSDVLEFLESRATEIEADARADREAGMDN